VAIGGRVCANARGGWVQGVIMGDDSSSGRYWDHAARLEDALNRKIDNQREAQAIFEMMTDEERYALAIAACALPPEGKYTRKWANNTLRNLTSARLVGLTAYRTLSHDDVDQHKHYEYYVERPKQQVEASTPKGQPFEVSQVITSVPHDVMLTMIAQADALPDPGDNPIEDE